MREPSQQRRLWQCFADAGKGLVSVFRTERNFRIHVVLFLLAVALGFFLRLSGMEWIALVLCSGLVLLAEVLNTALEYLADTVRPEADPGIGRAKDAAAGAVMIAAVAAMIVGGILFLPKLWELLNK